jgi:hypothetical protein
VSAVRARIPAAALAFLACAVATSQAAPASSAEPYTASDTDPDIDPYADRYTDPYTPLYAELLESHTSRVETTVGTVVDYRGLRQEPAASQWRRLLRALEAAPPPAAQDQALALWINAYNILAIDLVLRHYPVASIRDIGSLWSPVWKHEAGTVAGRSVSLHEVEHEILRPMGDPRIHAAIVCASTSCPSLWRRPYSASAIGEQLDDAMRRFLASSGKGLRIDRANGRLHVSPIFKWFQEDFDALGGVATSIRRYAPEAARPWLATSGRNAPIDYLSYDWSLNQAH